MATLGSCTGGKNEPPPAEVPPFRAEVPLAQSPADYIVQLGCLNCHGGATSPNLLKTRAPGLSQAGHRYRPEYIFDYLLNPRKVRNHIGLSRMPDFGFDEKEALALTLYLSGKGPAPAIRFPDFSGEGNARLGEKEFGALACGSCHSAGGQGHNVISDLSWVGSKLNPEWLRQFIAAPAEFQNGQSLMPALLYHYNEDSTALAPSVEGANEKIRDLSAYLLSLRSPRQDEGVDRYESVKKANPAISAALGLKIFRAQNCAGCHQSGTEGTWRTVVAPGLQGIPSRIDKQWLARYLQKPHAVRPFGFYPGSGSRMPDFNLTETEADSLVKYIYGEGEGKTKIRMEAPSRFVSGKIKTFLDEKLPCLGCHSLDGKGGKVAPDLANAATRLNPDYMALMVSSPATAMPGTIMPKVSMPQALRDQLIGYLLYHKDTVVTGKYLSLVDHPITLPGDNISVENIYATRCAICHGPTGRGDGFNARYLPTRPTVHADSSYMSTRADDTLFDGIYAGGYILNKSHLMPDWGNALSNDEIKGLVAYIRTLCHCSPPKWSTDNKTMK